jgi:hypothetical protein
MGTLKRSSTCEVCSEIFFATPWWVTVCGTCIAVAKSMVTDLLKLEEGLTEWEVKFLEDINKGERLSVKQVKLVFKLYREKI